MDGIDIKLSKIDNNRGFSYFRNAATGIHPQLLGINQRNRFYEFQLETFHLWEEPLFGKFKPVEHQHAVYHAVLYQQESVFLYHGREMRVSPGGLVLISPGEPHCFSPLTHQPTSYHEITFSLHCGERPLTITIAEVFSLYTGVELELTSNPLQLQPREHQLLNQHYEKQAWALQQGNQLPSSTVGTALTGLILHLADRLSQPTNSPDHGDLRLHQAKLYLEQHYTNALDLEELSSRSGISREHFCRCFKNQFGVAPIEYRQLLRLGAAERMLRFSELEIKEIAEQLGFADIYHFTKAFRNHYGIPPGRFRREDRH